MDLKPAIHTPERRPDVHVHIDRIVMIGVDVRDRAAVGEIVVNELKQHFSKGELPRQTDAMERVDAGVIRVQPRNTERSLGVQVAGMIHSGVIRGGMTHGGVNP